MNLWCMIIVDKKFDGWNYLKKRVELLKKKRGFVEKVKGIRNEVKIKSWGWFFIIILEEL